MVLQSSSNQDTIFDKIVESLSDSAKITKSSYIIFRSQENPVNAKNFWIEAMDIDVDEIDWASIHDNNFNSTLETQIRAFYFKIFHRAICTNQFLHKIGRTDSPLLFLSKINRILHCVTKSVPYGIIYALLLTRNVVKIWIYPTFRKCLVWIYCALNILRVLIF